MVEDRSRESQFARSRDVIDAASQAAREVLDALATSGPTSLPYIPGYEIVCELRHGGQGVVYKALQQATGRLVAVKALRDGPFTGPRERHRFEREIRILGQLRHPNIVTIHDSGIAAGCQFFAMDYINGEALDAFVAERGLAVSEILRMFLKVCKAIHSAHLLGVIHRDLKPSNIRVDDQGEPHILDFGLAGFSTDQTPNGGSQRHITMTGQFLGSLPWASPEHAAGSNEAIDLRSDIYSLGVMLYHALTGRFPYSITGGPRDVLTNVMEAEPVHPSTIRREIDRDLAAIMLKCLAKDPERRYQSAAAFADDVERYLKGEPVLACSPSAAYQISKLIQRHRLPFSLLVCLMAAITGFSVWMSFLYAQTSADRSRAVAAERDAKDKGSQATMEAARAEAINDFLVNHLLTSAEPANTQGRKVTVEQALRDAAARIDSALADQPLTKASVRAALGSTFMHLGVYDEAERQFRQASEVQLRLLGEDHVDALRTQVALVELMRRQGKLREGGALSEHILSSCRALLGEDHVLTLRAGFEHATILWYSGQVSESLELHWQTFERRRRILGSENMETLASLNEWGLVGLWESGRTSEAEALIREGLGNARRTLGERHPTTIGLMTSLGTVLMAERRFEEAESLLNEAQDRCMLVLGPTHPQTLMTALRYGVLLKEEDRVEQALVLFRRAVELTRDSFGTEHPLAQEAMLFLGSTLQRRGNDGESAKVFKELLDLCRRLYGDENEMTAHALDGLSLAYFDLGRFAEAEAGHRQALAVHRRTVGLKHDNAVWCLRLLDQALGALGRAEEARPFGAELLNLRRQAAERPEASAYQLNCYARELLTVEPPDLRDPQLALEVARNAFEKSADSYHYNRYILGLAFEANNMPQQAVEMLRSALANIPTEESRERREYEALLVRLLESNGDPQAAEQVHRSTIEARIVSFSAKHTETASAMDDLGQLLIRHGKCEEAAEVLHESLEIRRAANEDPEWRVGNTMRLLGSAIVQQNRHAAAEGLLLQALQRLTRDPWAPSEAVQESIVALASLYEDVGMPERAAVFRVGVAGLLQLSSDDWRPVLADPRDVGSVTD